jgi:hypothetical protein
MRKKFSPATLLVDADDIIWLMEIKRDRYDPRSHLMDFIWRVKIMRAAQQGNDPELARQWEDAIDGHIKWILKFTEESDAHNPDGS